MKYVVAFVLITLTIGCATTSVVADASSEEAISSISMSCKKPYELKQDCSIWSGATRTISIEGFDVKIAGSEQEDIVLVMDAHLYTHSALEGLTWHLAEDYHSVASNNSFEAVRKVLLENGITILRVRPLKSFGNIDGYALELDSDGYSLLKGYSKK